MAYLIDWGKDKEGMVPASPEKFEQTYYCQAGIAELGRMIIWRLFEDYLSDYLVLTTALGNAWLRPA